MKSSKNLIIAFIVLIIVASLYRVFPRPVNFAPHIAMALFGGAVISDKKWAFALPIFSMFLSDLLYHISAKTGEGVPELLDAVIERIPPPVGDPEAPLQALIFDSQFDQYRGVVSSVRVMNGRLNAGTRLRFMQTSALNDAIEIGVRRPVPTPVAELGPGEVGYLIAGIKEVGEARSGETVTTASHGATSALPGYRDPKPMVFSGLFPIDGDDFEDLRDSLEKLKLNDASITYTPETSGALGFGFRCGFLGLLHMEIVKERLEREFGLALIATAPSVEYRVHRTDGSLDRRRQPRRAPRPAAIDFIEEPFFKVGIITPTDYTGTLMELCQCVAASSRSWSTSRRSGSSCTTSCRWRRWWSTSSTS